MTAAIRLQPLIPLIGILLIAALLLSGGCSSVRLAYGQLDWWMDRSLNQYLELDGSQKALLFQRVDEFHRWHRQTQLPRYANYMEQVAAEVDVWGGTPAQMRQEEQRLRAFWQDSAGMLADLIMPIVIRLDDKQIAQLTENVREQREAQLKKWQQPRRRLDKLFRKQAERWLGGLTPEQEAIIDRYVATTTFDPDRRDLQRQRWGNTFLATLRTKPPAYERKLRRILLDPQSLWPEDYLRMQEQLRAEVWALAGEILQSTTTEQREHLKTTLQQYASDFRFLAAN